jgi:hypothetical protein
MDGCVPLTLKPVLVYESPLGSRNWVRNTEYDGKGNPQAEPVIHLSPRLIWGSESEGRESRNNQADVHHLSLVS